MPGPRMVPAADFLGIVHSVAPSRGGLSGLDNAFATATGRAPRTLARAVVRAEARGVVSEKVAGAVSAYLAPERDRATFRGRCPRCGCYRRRLHPSESAYCDPCHSGFAS